MDMAIESLITELSKILLENEWKIVTAESCTGGGLAYYLTNIPGSSNWFERGFVTYSNIAKQELLGVHHDTLRQHGAVSEETAKEMAQGALEHSQAQISIAITGIAGPDGGTDEKPVGTVWFAIAGVKHEPFTKIHAFKGDRKSIREQAIKIAVEMLINLVTKTS